MDARDAAPAMGLLARARLLVLDVDGVLTDGRIVYEGERQIQAFDVHDGLGLVLLRQCGVRVAWISSRASEAARRRAQELGIDEVHLACEDKGASLAEIQRRLSIPPELTVAMGDDLPDLALAAGAALFAAPANAREEIRARAALVTRARGGAGAVRELAEQILRAKGAWSGLLEKFSPRAP